MNDVTSQTTEATVKKLTGIVVSDKMQKTLVVSVNWMKPHPKYRKPVKRSTTYYVHDEHEVARKGDQVTFRASRPLSKLKHWSLCDVERKAR